MATAPPKRPRPITTTPSLRVDLGLADNGTLLRVAVGPLLAAQSKRRGQGSCSHTPHVHQHGHDELAEGRQIRRNPGRETDSRKGRDCLEQDILEREVGHAQEDQGPHGDGPDGQQDDGQGLALDFSRDAPPEDDGVGLPANLRQDDEPEQEEGRHPDAAGGSGAASADQHECVADSRAFPAASLPYRRR